MLAAYSDSNQTNCDLYLPLVLFAYRTSSHAITRESPFTALYGREARLLCDYDNYNNYRPTNFVDKLNYNWREAKTLIVKQAQRSKTHYDSKYVTPPPVYKVGDSVRLKQKTLRQGLKSKLRGDKWSEPFKVLEVPSPQNVRIQFKNKSKVINVNNLKHKEPERKESCIGSRLYSHLIFSSLICSSEW